MPGTFDEGMAELADIVGDGKLVAAVEVDQVYAHFQHQGLDLKHPRGGQAKYLEEPWLRNTDQAMRKLAGHAFEPDGLVSAATEIAEDGAKMVGDHAPVEFDNLRRSGHPTVTDDGATVYDRPPEVPRLSEEQLKAERRHES